MVGRQTLVIFSIVLLGLLPKMARSQTAAAPPAASSNEAVALVQPAPEVLPAETLVPAPPPPGGELEALAADPDSRVGRTFREMQRELDTLRANNLQLDNDRREYQRMRRFGLQLAPVPARDFLPVPVDPSNLFLRETSRAEANLGNGVRLGGTDLLFRAALTGNVQMWYDTGFVGSASTFDPSTIAPGGSSFQQAGVFDAAAANGELRLDLNAPLSDESQAQAYLETAVVGGGLQVRHAFGRLNLSTLNVLAGTYWTAWADEGTLPKTILNNSYPVGSNSLNQIPQLRLAFPTEMGIVSSIAIQQPLIGDVELRGAPNDDLRLQRYPDLAMRVRYFDGDYFSLSVGSLFHWVGRENVVGDEDFDMGWGFNAATRCRIGPDMTLMFGAVTGQGVATSIFGLSDSMLGGGAAGQSFSSLRNDGLYAGHQTQWTENLVGTIAYGYAQAEGVASAAGRTRSTQNGWVNLIWRLNKNVITGVQYDYGDHQIVTGQNGDDHRFSLVVSLMAGKDDDSTPAATGAAPAAAAAAAAAGGAGGARSFRNSPAPVAPPAIVPGGSKASRFQRL